MSTTMTAAAAFDYLFSLIKTATTPTTITAVDTELLTYVPGTYVELVSIDDHKVEIESLPNFAFLEYFTLTGKVSIFEGDINFEATRDGAFSVYETYVRTPIINDGCRLGNIVMWIVPSAVQPESEITNIGGSATTITFKFDCVSRVTNH